jgi:tripartite-type tricarboxylate transporter receptor subunit TctC
VASPQRAPRLPDLPTLTQADVHGVEADAWFALFAPAKTPPDTLNRLYNAVSSKLSAKTPAEIIAKQGMTLTLRPPEAVAAWLPGEVTKWAAVIKAAGVVVE